MSWDTLHQFGESVRPEVYELVQTLLTGLKQERFRTVRLSGRSRAPVERFDPIAVKILGWLVDAGEKGVGKLSTTSLGVRGEHAEATVAKKLDAAVSYLPADPEADAKNPDVLLRHMLQYWEFGQQALRDARSASAAGTAFAVVLGAVAIALWRGQQDEEASFFVYRAELVATDVAALFCHTPPEL